MKVALCYWNDTFLFVFSGRELFLSDASLFVDDAEAYDIYEREEEPDAAEERVISPILLTFCLFKLEKQLILLTKERMKYRI